MAFPNPSTSTTIPASVLVTVACVVCGKKIQRRKDRMPKEPVCGYKCNGVNRGRDWAKHGHKGRAAWSPATTEAYRKKIKGAGNPCWRGGVTLKRAKGNYKGVRYVRAPEWAQPMARKDGYMMEHRLVMARQVGRLLTRTEVVHHLDHDPANNRPENLELWPTNQAHKAAEGGRFAEGVANRVSLAA